MKPSNTEIPVRRALISVSDKTGLEDFARRLAGHGVEIISTGGTAAALRKAGIAVKDVAAVTGFPEIMGGRVKTLHPKIHGGLLARRNDDSHRAAMEENGIEAIDLLVVNLYPFARTAASGADDDECVENIDIGGPAMIRAAAKNHDFTAVVADPADYAAVAAELAQNDGALTLPLRRRLAAKAFALTAQYDSQIANWFSGSLSAETSAKADEGTRHWPQTISFSGALKQSLRYGENPHQSAALYTGGSPRPGVAAARQAQGKELSYNNLNDTDAAFELVAEFADPAVAIVKHANPCGAAVAATPLEAYKKALACDTTSAFGGIIALNRHLAALEMLRKKENLRLLLTGAMPDPAEKRLLVKSLAGGLLVQDADTGRAEGRHLKTVTKRAPTEAELRDLLFAFTVCKHVKSNAIVYAKDRATTGIGAGQMSRLDSARLAAQKGGAHVRGGVAASDAFFPFADGVLAAAQAGITAIIQPGGSIRDADVIAAADEKGLAMVLTGIRHFRH